MILLDTNIFIYLANGSLGASTLKQTTLAFPSIVKVEALGYPQITAQELSYLEQLFAACYQVDLSEFILQEAIWLRQRRRMTLGDAIVAATALVHDVELWTANTQDFAHVEGLRLHNPIHPAT